MLTKDLNVGDKWQDNEGNIYEVVEKIVNPDGSIMVYSKQVS